MSLVQDDFGDPLKSKLAISRGGLSVSLDENMLGGGEVSGLLRFQNTDMAEARNLLGRMTLAVTTSMNAQHSLGLDLDGNPGGNLFSPITFGAANVLSPQAPAALNTGTAALSLSVSDVSQLAASDYEITFTGATTGTITRRSDGKVTTFPQVPAPTAPTLATVDGLTISMPSGTPAAGDRFLIRPFSTSASNITSEFSSPRALAVASPVAGSLGASNTGSMQLTALVARSNLINTTPVTLTFNGCR